MITDMDIIMTDAGEIVLVVPGAVPYGALALSIGSDAISLAADGHAFAVVGDIDEIVIDTLAALDHVDLIAVPDEENPPAGITHQALVEDKR